MTLNCEKAQRSIQKSSQPKSNPLCTHLPNRVDLWAQTRRMVCVHRDRSIDAYGTHCVQTNKDCILDFINVAIFYAIMIKTETCFDFHFEMWRNVSVPLPRSLCERMRQNELQNKQTAQLASQLSSQRAEQAGNQAGSPVGKWILCMQSVHILIEWKFRSKERERGSESAIERISQCMCN